MSVSTSPRAPLKQAAAPVPAVPLTRRKLPRHASLIIPVLAAVLVAGLVTLTPYGFNIGLWAIGTLVLTGVTVYTWARRIEGRRAAFDRLVAVLVTTTFVIAITPLISLGVTVVSEGLARFDLLLFTSDMRNVVGEGGGIRHAITGTLVITGVTALISVPVGVLTAIYLVEYGHGRLARAITFFVDVMTGIPSIVAGLFAYALFALIFGPGIRLGVMGSVALSVLMIPIVVRSTEEMLKVVPRGLREASLALGVPKWRTIVKVVLPTALPGIVTGVTLAVARVIGETAPLLITAGVADSMNLDPFNGRMENLPVFVYNEYKFPGVPPDPYIDRAWAAALVLIMLVMALSLFARLISRRFGVKARS